MGNGHQHHILVYPGTFTASSRPLHQNIPHHLSLNRLAILTNQELVGLLRTLTNTSHDDTANTVLEHAGNVVLQLHVGLDSSGALLPSSDALKNGVESAQDSRGVLLEVVDDAVRASVKGVGGNGLAGLGVDALNGTDGSLGNVVHVENGRVGVRAASVEGVGVAHRDLGELGEVTVADGLLHKGHVSGHHLGDTLLEEAGGGNGLLHARGGRHTLLGSANDEDQSTHLGPVRGGSNQVGHGVGAVLLVTHPPSNVAAEQTPASRSRALSGNKRQLLGRVWKLIEIGNGTHQRGKAGSRGGQASGSGEVVLGDESQGQARQLGQRRVGGLKGGSAGTQLTEACLGTGSRDIRQFSVERQAVAVGEGLGAGGGGKGAEVGLREGDREGAVGGKVELCVTLSPVPNTGVSLWGDLTALQRFKTYLTTAMLTGAVVLAR